MVSWVIDKLKQVVVRITNVHTGTGRIAEVSTARPLSGALDNGYGKCAEMLDDR